MDRELIQLAMQWLRDFEDDRSACKQELERRDIAALTALLESAIAGVRLTTSDRQLFDGRDINEAAGKAIEILAIYDAIGTIPAIVQYLESLVTRNEFYRDDHVTECIIEDLGEFSGEGFVSLMRHALASDRSETVRCILIEVIDQWGGSQQGKPSLITPLVAEGLRNAANNPIRVNTDLMRLVIRLKLNGLGELIEQAFSLDRIDCAMAGEWEQVRRQLNVAGLGLPMPEHPYNSSNELGKKVGIGIFSNDIVFMEGELQDEAAREYLDNAMDAFSNSDEGQRLRSAGMSLSGVYHFLGLALNYHGVTVDSITVDTAREVLLVDYPRKVSMQADGCAEVVDELCGFWRFVDRVHGLELAREIEKEIRKSLPQFHSRMSDPRRFGMAKRFFMEGMAAGFDMTSEEGLNEFLAIYNSRMANDFQPQPRQQAPIVRLDPVAPDPISSMSLKQRKKLWAKQQKKRR